MGSADDRDLTPKVIPSSHFSPVSQTCGLYMKYLNARKEIEKSDILWSLQVFLSGSRVEAHWSGAVRILHQVEVINKRGFSG